eukprot:m.87402 g.87402  ORF g.87402 m.87402 type:complete len:1814 (+) comp11554_c0_seq1:414-5855(+)
MEQLNAWLAIDYTGNDPALSAFRRDIAGLRANTVTEMDMSQFDWWLWWPLISDALHDNTSLQSLKLQYDPGVQPKELLLKNDGSFHVRVQPHLVGSAQALCLLKDGSIAQVQSFQELLASVPEQIRVSVVAWVPTLPLKTLCTGLRDNIVTSLDFTSGLNRGWRDSARLLLNSVAAGDKALQTNTSVRHLRAVWSPEIETLLMTLRETRSVALDICATDFFGVVVGLQNDTLSEIQFQLHPYRDDVPSIVAALEANTSLRVLNLASPENGFPVGNQLVPIVAAVREHDSIKVLNLANSYELGDQGAVHVAEVLSRNPLEVLILSKCAIHGAAAEIGTAITPGSVLRILDLSFNCINDEAIIPIATALKLNVSLEWLDLSFNCIGDVSVDRIASALQHNKTLRGLNLRGNPISTEASLHLSDRCAAGLTTPRISDTALPDVTLSSIAHAIAGMRDGTAINVNLNQNTGLYCPIGDASQLAKALALNSTIQTLDLCNLHLCDQGVWWLAIALNYSTLRKLNLSFNGLTWYGVLGVAWALSDNTYLEELVLDCNLGAPFDFQSVSDNQWACLWINVALQMNTTLKILSLEGCPLWSPGVFSLLTGLAGNTALVELNLNKTNIGDIGGIFQDADLHRLTGPLTPDLFLALAPNSTLQTLRLEDNQLGDTGAISLAAALKGHASLCELYLHTNCIGDDGAEALGAALEHNTVLRVLHFGLTGAVFSFYPSGFGNFIGDRGARALARMLEVNTALVELDLTLNRIELSGAEALGEALNRNSALQTLRIARNNFGGTGVAAFLKRFENNCTLKHLDLSNSNPPIRTLGVEFLNTRHVEEVDMTLQNLEWPPPSVTQPWPQSRDAIYRFLESAAASSSPLVRSRIMLLGNGGSGKTTLKTALLLSRSEGGGDSLAGLRQSILERIRCKWKEADVRSWVDNDLAKPGFFDTHCPLAAGITGARLLEYTTSKVIAVFGASETEHAKRVVDKLVRVLCFLHPERAAESVARDVPPTNWEWITNLMQRALDRLRGTSGSASGSRECHYGALLDIPHVWTEGIALDQWKEAGFTLWDLPGQMELNPAHCMFSASATAVHVLLVNGSTKLEGCITQLEAWLGRLKTSLQQLLPHGVQVRIVVTHTDDMLQEERENLLSNLHRRAQSTFRQTFDFGDRCFATLYDAANGGDVEALRTDLVRLKDQGMPGYLMPTEYQRVCDDIVKMSQERPRWPVVCAESLKTHGPRLDDVLSVLQDLGFVRRVREKIILEPVTWLSRIMTAFLHPYHGVCSYVVPPGTDSVWGNSVEEHLSLVTITSADACRIVNTREPLIDRANEATVLQLLSHFDVCFELQSHPDKFVFPALLPFVDRGPSWLRMSSNFESRRYECKQSYDVIPPMLCTVLLKKLSRKSTRIAFLGRCTAVLSDNDTCYGFCLAADDKALDLFASGTHAAVFLSSITAHFAVVTSHHFRGLCLNKRRVISASSCNVFASPLEHPLLGKCSMLDVAPACSEIDTNARVDTWLNSLPPTTRSVVLEIRDIATRRQCCNLQGPLSGKSLVHDVLFELVPVQSAQPSTCQNLDELRYLQAKLALQKTVQAVARYANDVFRSEHQRLLSLYDVQFDVPGPLAYKPLPKSCQKPDHDRCSKCEDRLKGLDPMAEELRKLHQHPEKIQWVNSDATKWHKPECHIELAKLYCPGLGGLESASQKTDVLDLDATAVFNMLSWCTLFPKELIGKEGIAQQAVRARNDLEHLPKMAVGEKTHKNVFQSMQTLLEHITKEKRGCGSSEAAKEAAEVLSKLAVLEEEHNLSSQLARQREIVATASEPA